MKQVPVAWTHSTQLWEVVSKVPVSNGAKEILWKEIFYYFILLKSVKFETVILKCY